MSIRIFHATSLLVVAVAPAVLTAADALPYRAREAVRRQKSNVDKAAAKLSLFKKQATWKAYPYKVKPGLGLSPLLESIERDLTSSGAPKDHPESKPLYDKVAEIRAALPELEKTLTAKHAEWVRLSDVKNYPHFEKDVDRLDELWRKYKAGTDAAKRAAPSKARIGAHGVPMAVGLMSDIDKFAAACRDYGDDADYFNGTMKRYAVLMKVNKSAESRLMAKAGTAAKYMKAFHAARESAIATFPPNIRANMTAAAAMIDKAVAEKKPMFLTGGVKQALDYATKGLETFVAVKGAEDAEAKKLQGEYAALIKKKDKAESALAAQLLADQRAPADRYVGSDKAELIARIQAAWQKKYPTDKVLAIRAPMANWKRSTKWKVNAVKWYKVDTSHLLFNVIVQLDKKVAVIYPAYLNKDHLQGDAITPGVETKGSGYGHAKMLIANLK